MEQYMGQIMMFGGNFAPRGWALCDGQLLAISQNEALFSILGTTYGGDGRTTFGLPDLRGRAPVHPGQAPGTTDNIVRGQKGGNDTHTLSTSEIPAHNHDASTIIVTLACNGEDGTTDEADGANFGNASSGTPYNTNPNDSSMGAGKSPINIGGTTANTGDGRAFSTRNPFQGINYIIALPGIYPPRN